MRLDFNNDLRVIAGISEKVDGSMVWWNKLPVDDLVCKNRDQYFEKIGIDPKRVVAGGIEHGVKVGIVGEAEAGQYLLNTDALITNVPNLFLTITAADCLPVFFYDMISKSIGIVHAGWRGLIDGILENTVQELGRSYGSNPENLSVIIGPHIKNCCYEIGEEVANKFIPENIEQRAGKSFANLGFEAKMRLNKVGVNNVFVSDICTFDDPRFFSARRDKDEPIKGVVGYIGIK